MIRMSSNQFAYNYKITLNEAYSKQEKLMEQGDGGKLHRPSDNAVDYAKLLRYNISDNENKQYGTNVQTALSWMKTADAAAVQMTEIQKNFKGKTTAAANSYNSDTDMLAIGKEMMSGIQEIVALGNSQQGDRYLFSGQADLTQPFSLSTEPVTRGLAKTLDAKQKEFFNDVDGTGSVTQMLEMVGSDGETYYLNTLTGNLYTKKFMDEGYKDQFAQGNTHVQAGDEVANIAGFGTSLKVKDYFKNTGEILASTASPAFTGVTVTKDRTTGRTVNVDFSFSTIQQQIATYSGDSKHISMVKINGSVDPTSDTVNMTGQDLFGSDIFDDANSGNLQSGTAMLNNMLTVYQQTVSSNYSWLSSDGMTLADGAHAVTLTAESRMGARAQLYDSVAEMLTTQGENITADITRVSSTDVGKLAIDLMEQQTLYNLSLSLGARVIPQSLADYL